MKTLDELDALYEKATEGPWAVDRTGTHGADIFTGTDPWQPACGVARTSGDRAHADAAFIAAMHSSWPEVRERLRRAEAESERLRDEICRATITHDGEVADYVEGEALTRLRLSLRAALTEEPRQ